MANSQPTSASAEQITRDSLQIFTNHLLAEWGRTKTPYGLDEALALALDPGATQEDPETAARQETAVIFLNCGFQAWLAYFLATHHQGRHYKGQKGTTETITAFNRLPKDDRRRIAAALASIKSHATVQDAIQKLMESRKRRRKLLLHPLSQITNNIRACRRNLRRRTPTNPSNECRAIKSPKYYQESSIHKYRDDCLNHPKHS